MEKRNGLVANKDASNVDCLRQIISKSIFDNNFPKKGEGIFKRYTGHHGHVKILIEESLERMASSFLCFEVSEIDIPDYFRLNILKAIENFCLVYYVNRIDALNLNFTIIGGSSHDVDSRDSDYEIATYYALLDAFSKKEI